MILGCGFVHSLAGLLRNCLVSKVPVFLVKSWGERTTCY